MAQVHLELLGCTWVVQGPCKHCPSWRWDCQGGDTLGGKGTQVGSAGVLPLCCQSQPLEHTQTGIARFKICIGYGDGRKSSSGATLSWLRPHPLVPKPRSVSLPPQGGLCPRLVPLVIRMPPQKPHANPSSHDTPPSACDDLVSPGDRAHCWPQPHTSPWQGTAVSPTAPPNPVQGGAFPNPPLASPSPPTSPSGWRTRRPEWGLSPTCPPCQTG